MSVDRQRFPTLSRVAFGSNAVLTGVLKFIQQFGWKQVAVIRAASDSGYNEAKYAFIASVQLLEKNNIKINYQAWVKTDQSTEETDEILDNIRAKVRIVILFPQHACGDELALMRRANERGLLTG